MMTDFSDVSRAEALRFARVVSTDERLPGAVLSASAGAGPVDFGSLLEVGEFLEPVTAEELFERGMSAKVRHLDPRMLVAWVREVIGDEELAVRIEAVVNTDVAYGLLVPDMKALIVERVAQFADVEGSESQMGEDTEAGLLQEREVDR